MALLASPAERGLVSLQCFDDPWHRIREVWVAHRSAQRALKRITSHEKYSCSCCDLQECYPWLHFGKFRTIFVLVVHCGVSRNSSHKNKSSHHVLCIKFFLESMSWSSFFLLWNKRRNDKECSDNYFSNDESEWGLWSKYKWFIWSMPYINLSVAQTKPSYDFRRPENIVHKYYGLCFFFNFFRFFMMLWAFCCHFFNYPFLTLWKKWGWVNYEVLIFFLWTVPLRKRLYTLHWTPIQDLWMLFYSE